jgi:hypothetical protein
MYTFLRMPFQKLLHPIVGDGVRNVAVATWAQRHYFGCGLRKLKTHNRAKVDLKLHINS